jgi:hypothetical protein
MMIVGLGSLKFGRWLWKGREDDFMLSRCGCI